MKISLAASPKQAVNQWLGIAFIALICFWVVLYYFVNKTEAFGETYVLTIQSSVDKYAK